MTTSTNRDELGKTPADYYCKRLVREVNCLEQMLSRSTEYGIIGDGEDGGELRDLWNALAAIAGSKPESYTPSFSDYCNEYGLELVTLGERSNSGFGWRVAGARLLLTDGGPRAWLEWQVGSEWIQVNVRWPSCNADEFVRAPCTAKGFGEETSW